MGTFCGRFIDEHESTDDEGEKKEPKKRSTRRFSRKKKSKTGGQNPVGPSSTLVWAPYLCPIQVSITKNAKTVVREFARLRVEKKMDISTGMLEAIQQIHKLYSIELIRCKLDTWPKGLGEMSDLHIIRVSHNDMTSFPSDKFYELQQIQLDNNKIRSLDPAHFTEKDLNELTVLNLNNNLLQSLPANFGSGLKKLEYLDISYNKISWLPSDTCIFDCPVLEVLILAHNQLPYIPSNLGSLRSLKKLFLSFNNLTELPDSIGDCSNLTILRVVQNNIRVMPASLLKLWKRRGGKLEELLVDRNPIIQPSITAFEMGGLDRAMKLFAEYLEGDTASIRISFEPEVDVHGNASVRASIRQGSVVSRVSHPRATINSDDAADLGVSTAQPSQSPPATSRTVERKPTQEFVRRPSMRSEGSLTDRKNGQGGANQEETAVRPTGVRVEDDSEISECDNAEEAAADYYFSGVTPYDEIRSAESSILLLKKMMYVCELQKSAAAKRNGGDPRSPISPAEQAILDKPDLQNFAGDVPVCELDLYLCLLVYVTKSMYSTVDVLFDKFETGDKGYLSRQEWANFCTRVDINVPPHIEQKAWNLLAWRIDQHEQAYLVDFIAAWHCHDLEVKDDIIAGVAKVLNLKYYEMSREEVSNRVHSVTSSGESATDHAHRRTWMPHHAEGEKRISANRTKTTPVPVTSRTPRDDPTTPKGRVSLTNHEYMLESQNQEDSDCADSDVGLDSSDLSDESMSSVSSLDKSSVGDVASQAADAKVEVEEKRLVLENDGDLHSLMLNFNAHHLTNQNKEQKLKRRQKNTKAPKKKQASVQMRKQVRDNRFKSDVVPVRKCIRDVYRSRPPDDFFKMVNFLLRGMRYIKHAPPAQASYWHESDPIFANTIANNTYSMKLLEVMGFYKLGNYWVWPAIHIKVPAVNAEENAVCWGDQEIPKDWIGRQTERLEDMILLFKHCQKALMKADGNFSNFSGHF